MATVLIVDDVSAEAQLMARVVQQLGHHPVLAPDGESALNTARAASPSLILMDVVMPGMNGFEACRKIKKDKDFSGVPIIMVTTKDQETDKFWATKQGAAGYVTKPFTPDSLATVIRQHIQ